MQWTSLNYWLNLTQLNDKIDLHVYKLVSLHGHLKNRRLVWNTQTAATPPVLLILKSSCFTYLLVVLSSILTISNDLLLSRVQGKIIDKSGKKETIMFKSPFFNLDWTDVG